MMKFPNLIWLLNYIYPAQGVRQHCHKKKAATVGQNGRLSALCNFSVFDLQDHVAPHIKSQTMRHPLMN